MSRRTVENEINNVIIGHVMSVPEKQGLSIHGARVKLASEVADAVARAICRLSEWFSVSFNLPTAG